MRQYKLRRSYRGRDITALVLQMSGGVHVSLYGGDLPHIGAVGIVDTEGNCTVTEFPPHREGVVCQTWIDALSAVEIRPAVVEAGIHYDNLDNAGIRTVLSLTGELLGEALQHLLTAKTTT